MTAHLVISIRFLDPAFHGCRESGEPEWPPSPLRLYQALVAAAARPGGMLAERVTGTFKWFEGLSAPFIVAPAAQIGSPVRTAVPNNDLDTIAHAWSKHQEPKKQPSELKKMKTVRPMWLRGGDAVHYLWDLSESDTSALKPHIDVLSESARRVAALGWGINLAIGDCALVPTEVAGALEGERWFPTDESRGDGLRIPTQGTLDDLQRRHAGFLGRIGPDGFKSPPTLSIFQTLVYRRTTDSPQRAFAAFSLLKDDASGFQTFDGVRSGLTLVGMVRHATKLAAATSGWLETRVNSFVLGHAESRNESQHVAPGSARFAYLPLPSIESRRDGWGEVVGSIRRVVLTAFSQDCDAEVKWVRRALSGTELVSKPHAGSEQAEPARTLLSMIPETDKMVQRYVRQATTWATVTPVVLPGYDDPAHYRRRLQKGTSANEQKQLLSRLEDRIDGLLRKAIVQAGFGHMLAKYAQLEWRSVGFLPGVHLASRYGVPDHLKRFPSIHVRIGWRDSQGKSIPVRGPVCIGGGRFYGLGLCVATNSDVE